MGINRELIHSTIYDRFVEAFEDDEDFKTISRLLKHIDDMQPEDLHALFIIGGDQSVTQQNHAPKKYTMRMDIYIYVARKGSDDVPQTILNRALDKVDQVLDPPHGFPAQTFSIPSVQHIRVEGDIKTDEGALGDFAVAVVPLQIVAVG